ncbi:MAG TPA: hypothetical protein VET87_13740 [Rubrivivax sp.]|nr:hypothetical protein [Rubrivivax sp.]
MASPTEISEHGWRPHTYCARVRTIPLKASAKVGRCFRSLHSHGLIAKIPRTRRWRVTNYGRNGMGATMYMREHHFPNVYAGVVH